MAIDDLMRPESAVSFLAAHLQEGTLVIFLGSGVSSDMGLPTWLNLINDLRSPFRLSPLSYEDKAEDLQMAADDVRDKCASDQEFFKLLKKCLYKKVKDLDSLILKNDLLIALGALLMGSKRGSVSRVVTLNFDSMLERFLSLYGFVARAIYKLPALEGGEDARIYHPHGFLPHRDLGLPDSDFIILGLDSINERLATPGQEWFEKTRDVLRSSVCLFLGLSERSFSDKALLGPLLKGTGVELKAQRPTGVWILLNENEIAETTRHRFLKNNVAPLRLRTPEDISDFLLKICQAAAPPILT